MPRIPFTLLAALLGAILITPAVAGPENRALLCNGCSESRMASKASRATNQGIVYVFDANRSKTHKYEVFTEVIDQRPYTTWTQAISVTPEQAVRTAFKEFREASANLQSDEVVNLPPNFPIRSVAGYLVDPARGSTFIEDHIANLSAWSQRDVTFMNLAAQLTGRNIPVLDIGHLLDRLTITIVFPDGSSHDFFVDANVNAFSFSLRAELESRGNARMANGEPAPTAASSFIGGEFEDQGGSLNEWAEWARSLGAAIIGDPATGTTMTCSVEGNVIRCRVVGRR
jgi:hypothetical protein